MTKNEWFENKKWNAKIEEQFFNRLARAREKGQYLFIQADMLKDKYPQVALMLLDQFITQYKDQIFEARAYLNKAECLIKLNKTSEARLAFHDALEAERRFPNVHTSVELHYSRFVIEYELNDYYEEAEKALDEFWSPSLFPADSCDYYAAKAIFIFKRGDKDKAKEYAVLAHQERDKTSTGLRYHKKLGLVCNHSQKITKLLKEISS